MKLNEPGSNLARSRSSSVTWQWQCRKFNGDLSPL